MSFIKMMKSRKTAELMKDRNAFALLALIAFRAKRTNDFSVHGLEMGEALIGDYKTIGLTEKKYRLAKERLKKYGLAAFKGTNKGTVARLTNTDIYDINAEQRGGQKGERGANKGRLTRMNKEDKKNIYSQNQVPYQAIVDLFNETLAELPGVKLLTDERKKTIKSRWNTKNSTKSLDWWKEYFLYIHKSDFLMGRTDKFRATFDWITKKNNFVKIIEGNYHK